MPSLTHTQESPTSFDGADVASAERSDEQLVALLRQGRHDAFEILAARYHTRLLRFCWKILRSKEDAEDALQDVFVSAFRALVADDRQIHVRPWLYRIARNRCVNELRRTRTTRADSLSDDHPDGGRTVVERAADCDRLRELVEDLQALPDTQRTALLLREIDGFGYLQIATAMSTTVPGVKSLLVRARTGLRDSAHTRDTRLAGPGPGPPAGRHRARARRNARTITYRDARASATRA